MWLWLLYFILGYDLTLAIMYYWLTSLYGVMMGLLLEFSFCLNLDLDFEWDFDDEWLLLLLLLYEDLLLSLKFCLAILLLGFELFLLLLMFF